MKIVETVAEVQEQVKAWRKEGLTVGLVLPWVTCTKDIRA